METKEGELMKRVKIFVMGPPPISLSMAMHFQLLGTIRNNKTAPDHKGLSKEQGKGEGETKPNSPQRIKKQQSKA